jgi:hypothetical protein
MSTDAETFLSSWICTGISVSDGMYISDLSVVTIDIQALVPLWHEGLYPGMLIFILIVVLSEGHN